MKSPRNPRAFTLIELLVVIAIIAILAALMFPTIGGVLNQAKKATAKNDAVQIANAVIMYESEYGRFPTASSTNVEGALLNALIGATNDAAMLSNNPRGIAFLEVGNWKKGKGGIVDPGANAKYNDPWNRTYHIVMDTNYTNGVTAPGLTNNSLANMSFRKRVVVYNDGFDDTTPTFNKKYFVNSAE